MREISGYIFPGNGQDGDSNLKGLLMNRLQQNDQKIEGLQLNLSVR